MSRGSINKVILIGNLGADPDVRTSPNGTVVTNIRIATSEVWKDQQGQLQERTEWHRITFFGRTAETVRDYLRKGAKVYIEGTLRTSSYEKNGEKRYSTDIVANEMQMLDRAGSESREPYGRPTPPPPGPDIYPQSPRNPSQPPPGTDPDPFDDDIPF